MRYRRMEPQPSPVARLRGATRDGGRVYEVDQPGPAVEPLRRPGDMPKAEPWQDLNKTWFWRQP